MSPVADAQFSGLLVRLQPLREADLIVSLLTESGTIVDALARGARRSKKRFRGALELFTVGDVRLTRGRGKLPTLSGFDALERLAPSEPSYERLCVASSVLELAYTCAQPDQHDPQLYRWVRASLVICEHADTDTLRWAMLLIDISLLAALGTLPDLAHCGRCGASTVDGASWPRPDEELLCLQCQPNPSLDGETIATFRMALTAPVSALDRRVGARSGAYVRQRVDWLMQGVIGRPLKSRAALS